MALVDYDSSDGEEENIQAKALVNPASSKHNRFPQELPPLPSKFHDLYASTTRVSTQDDPSLHGGRKRVTPHVEGNWPTHLYIEWYPSSTEHGILSQLISTLKDAVKSESANVHSSITSDLGAPLPLHISMSRSIGFTADQKDFFLLSLEHITKSSGIRPFDLHFSDLNWVPNFEKSRWFLVLKVKKPDGNGLNKLLFLCNKTAEDYGQQPLYAQARENSMPKNRFQSKQRNASNRRGSELKINWTELQEVSDAFHISIAWTLQSPSTELLEATKAVASDRFENVKKLTFKVEEIKAKLGNVVTNISFPKFVAENKGLFGF